MFLTETFIIKFLLKIDHISGKSDYSESVSKLSKKKNVFKEALDGYLWRHKIYEKVPSILS